MVLGPVCFFSISDLLILYELRIILAVPSGRTSQLFVVYLIERNDLKSVFVNLFFWPESYVLGF